MPNIIPWHKGRGDSAKNTYGGGGGKDNIGEESGSSEVLGFRQITRMYCITWGI